jgi:hypothetical protein
MSAVLQDPQLMEVNPPLVRSEDYHDLTEQISSIVEGDVVKTPTKYWITLAITASVTGVLGLMLAYLVSTGIGVWAITGRSAGRGTSPTSFSGSVSATPAH